MVSLCDFPNRSEQTGIEQVLLHTPGPGWQFGLPRVVCFRSRYVVMNEEVVVAGAQLDFIPASFVALPRSRHVA